ncbi:hypothetical protein MWMV10_MWMV10_00789 [Acinetobacter baumannii]|nr:hypothetical protein MWMV10_MWMV10_00789 [Acinetobacter baumannii]CAI4205093.1 hypothetical protein MWMV15_MWMV15_00014 [Acinetobacter baumannii]
MYSLFILKQAIKSYSTDHDSNTSVYMIYNYLCLCSAKIEADKVYCCDALLGKRHFI